MCAATVAPPSRRLRPQIEIKLHNLGSTDGIFAPNELHLSSIQRFYEFKEWTNIYTILLIYKNTNDFLWFEAFISFGLIHKKLFHFT